MNPRAAVNDLHPFQGCPFGQLGYFSKLLDQIELTILDEWLPCGGIISGEGGIRTHAPFRTNGFQDRLVMTTSIPLRVRHFWHELDSTIEKQECQHKFLFFSKFRQPGEKKDSMCKFIC